MINKLLHKVELMRLFPDYIDTTSDQAYFKTLFFDVAIKLVSELKIKTDKISTIGSYFSADFGTLKKKDELIAKLKEVRYADNLDTHHVQLGFRSIYILLDDNKLDISDEYANEIEEMLRPFFLNTICPIEYSIRY